MLRWWVGAKLRGGGRDRGDGDARRRRVGVVGERSGWDGVRMCVRFGLGQWDGRGRLERAGAVGAPVAGVAVAAAGPVLVMTRCVARSRTCFCNCQGTSLGTSTWHHVLDLDMSY